MNGIKAFKKVQKSSTAITDEDLGGGLRSNK